MADADATAPTTSGGISPGGLIKFSLLNLFVLGLVQLLCWLGNGVEDPFFPRPVTVLQVSGCLASLIQIAVFIPSFALQTEKVYDLVGTATNIACILYTLLAGMHVRNNDVDIRAVLASVCALLWTSRLGYFLYRRRHRANAVDTRFKHLVPSFLRFLFVWNVQGLWIVFGLLPVLILNSTQNRAAFLATDAIGGAFFCLGWGLEIVADWQKSTFNSNPINKGKWIDTGLWYYTRHPNYFFEWMLQFGLFLLSVAELEGSQFIAVASPVFVACLLWFVSGVPLLERGANAKWKHDPDYMTYRRRTSVCIPFFKFAPQSDGSELGLLRRWVVGEAFWDEKEEAEETTMKV